MKRILLGSFVGAIILFVWSFLAWALLPIHLKTFLYTPAQDSILKVLATSNMESGAYAVPMADNRNAKSFDSKYQNEAEQVMKENAGKPAATVYYRKEGYDMNGGTIARGFLFNLIAVFAATVLLVPAFLKMNSYFGRWWLAIMVGLLINATGPLIQFNWMGMPWNFTMDMVLDNFLNWGIVGLWLAHFFRPK
jgi:hypothetical protein